MRREGKMNIVNKADSIKWMQSKSVLLKIGTRMFSIFLSCFICAFSFPSSIFSPSITCLSAICQEDARILRGNDFDNIDEEEFTPRTTTPTTPRTPVTASNAVEKAAKSFLTAVNGAGNVGRKKVKNVVKQKSEINILRISRLFRIGNNARK